jgi:V/A-type H+-transporting ATPase subunit A
MSAWWTEQGYGDWEEVRSRALSILQRESRLQQIVQLIGADALPDDQRLVLEVARLLREGFLQQDAMDDIDTFTTAEKQIRLLQLILAFHDRAADLIEQGCPIVVLREQSIVDLLVRMKATVANDELEQLDEIEEVLHQQMDDLAQEYA